MRLHDKDAIGVPDFRRGIRGRFTARGLHKCKICTDHFTHPPAGGAAGENLRGRARAAPAGKMKRRMEFPRAFDPVTAPPLSGFSVGMSFAFVQSTTQKGGILQMSAGKLLPLEGIKIVELGTHVAVPNAARYMATLGAEVVKVESIRGDEWRGVGVSYGAVATVEENPVYTSPNSNKRFLSLNLKDPEGKRIMDTLLARADVFMSNVRMGSLMKLGLDYESLKAANPGLIYCHFTGFGQKGPDAARPGFDTAAFWAKGGLMADLPFEGDYPLKPSGAIGDSIVSSNVACGVLTALLARQRTGLGTMVTTSLYQNAIWVNAANVITAQEMYHNRYPKSKKYPDDPLSFVYRSRDGEWFVTAIVDYNGAWEKVCRVYDMEDLLHDERYSTEAAVLSDPERACEVSRRIQEAFGKKDSDEWSRILTEADIVFSRAGHIADIAHDEQAWANDYLERVTYPSGTEVAMPRIPVQFSEYGMKDCQPTGDVGRDTREILSDIGLSDEEIARLREKNVVR